ncbi:MAG: hypothetical protein P8127_07860, partial [Acidobacteriota bacterium]
MGDDQHTMGGDEQPTGTYSGPDPDGAPTASFEATATASRGQIGPYRLLQKIGEGGMGEVWLAEQSAPVKRRVAVKVIKRGMDSKA